MMRLILSIFSSDFKLNEKIWKNFKRVMGLVIEVSIFLFVTNILNFMYYNPDTFERIMWHSFYEQENIDNVYLGSSHVYCSINPHLLDRLNGADNFNLSTGSQRIQESYYNLLEADRLYDIKNVYLELYYFPSTGTRGNYRDAASMTNSWRQTDNMHRTSPIRYQALWNMNDAEHAIGALFPFSRYRKYLFDWEGHIGPTVARKCEKDYADYKYASQLEDGYLEYQEKGFYYCTREYEPDIFTTSRVGEEMYMTEDAEIYLRKLICYCQKNDLKLTLFISPIYEATLISTENYDSYVDSVRNIAVEYKLPFYDFNLCKEDYLPIQNEKYFMDIGHLNAKGAEMFTNFFHIVVSGTPEKAKPYFYDTYEEKLANATPQLYGVYQIITSDADRIYVLAASQTEEMEFRVILTRDDEDGKSYDTPSQQMLQDFNANREFILPMDEHGIFTIVWRLKSEPDKVTTMEFAY